MSQTRGDASPFVPTRDAKWQVPAGIHSTICNVTWMCIARRFCIPPHLFCYERGMHNDMTKTLYLPVISTLKKNSAPKKSSLYKSADFYSRNIFEQKTVSKTIIWTGQDKTGNTRRGQTRQHRDWLAAEPSSLNFSRVGLLGVITARRIWNGTAVIWHWRVSRGGPRVARHREPSQRLGNSDLAIHIWWTFLTLLVCMYMTLHEKLASLDNFWLS